MPPRPTREGAMLHRHYIPGRAHFRCQWDKYLRCECGRNSRKPSLSPLSGRMSDCNFAAVEAGGGAGPGGEGDFDLLLDVHMPELDGFQVAEAVGERKRTTGAHLPIVALTARALSAPATPRPGLGRTRPCRSRLRGPGRWRGRRGRSPRSGTSLASPPESRAFVPPRLPSRPGW